MIRRLKAVVKNFCHNEKQVEYYRWLLTEGKEFSADMIDIEQSEKIKNLYNCKVKECYANCQKVAIQDSNFLYIEGYATSIIPVSHAWLFDFKNNKIVDPTWVSEKRKFNILDYFGIVIPEEFVVKRMLITAVYDDLALAYYRHKKETVK